MTRTRILVKIVSGALCLNLFAAPQTPISASAEGVCPRGGNELGVPSPSSVTGTGRPVVFVHGWTGKPMKEASDKLMAQFPQGQLQPFLFDYSNWSLYWASSPNIAACLADYVNSISSQYAQKGGDGKIVVIAHSMGGLAIRYATDSRFVKNPVQAATMPYVITYDTPYAGSPFGGSSLIFKHLRELLTINKPKPEASGADAGLCLAEHKGTSKLPNVCGGLPPYLPTGVNLTEIAGDVTINRVLFGKTIYSVPLNSDGIVGVPSQHGYLTSGPDAMAPTGVKTYNKIDSCQIGSGDVGRAMSNLPGSPGPFTINAFIDYFTLRDLQNGTITDNEAAFYAAVSKLANCGHSNITTDQSAVNQATEAIKQALDHLPAPPVAKSTNTSGSPQSTPATTSCPTGELTATVDNVSILDLKPSIGQGSKAFLLVITGTLTNPTATDAKVNNIGFYAPGRNADLAPLPYLSIAAEDTWGRHIVFSNNSSTISAHSSATYKAKENVIWQPQYGFLPYNLTAKLKYPFSDDQPASSAWSWVGDKIPDSCQPNNRR